MIQSLKLISIYFINMTSIIIQLLLYLHDCTVIWKVYFVHVHLINIYKQKHTILNITAQTNVLQFFQF